jgi:hypothetical protein
MKTSQKLCSLGIVLLGCLVPRTASAGITITVDEATGPIEQNVNQTGGTFFIPGNFNPPIQEGIMVLGHAHIDGTIMESVDFSIKLGTIETQQLNMYENSAHTIMSDSLYVSYVGLNPFGTAVQFSLDFFSNDLTEFATPSALVGPGVVNITEPSDELTHSLPEFGIPNPLADVSVQFRVDPPEPEPASLVIWSVIGAMSLFGYWRRRRSLIVRGAGSAVTST